MKNNFLKTNRKAFTLIELLVSLTIFSFVVVMAVGALYSAQSLSAKAQGSQIILDGMNLSMETISRDIRYASNFYCDTSASSITTKTSNQDCTEGVVLYFKPIDSASDNDRVAYYLDISAHAIMKKDFQNATTESVTSTDIYIDKFNFYVDGSGSRDTKQPKITIVIAGHTNPNNPKNKQVVFRLQNTVTSRVLDYAQ